MKKVKYLPEMVVKILDRDVLIAAGYEDNTDADDFLNLIAGKEIKIKEEINDFIYTCYEYPDVAIYKVFIEKIVYAELTSTQTGFALGLHRETVRRCFNDAVKKLQNIVQKDENIMEYVNEQ